MKALSSRSRRYLRITLVIIALLAIGMGYWQWQKARQADQAKSQYTALDVRVVWTDDVFRIVNLDTRTWLNCQFVLNRAGSKTGYIFFRDRVQSREVLQIAHELFTDSAGKAYQYKKDPPTSFDIRCEDVDNSVGLFSGRYTK